MQLFTTKYKDLVKESCIYKITCTANNKIYVGSTISFQKRVKDHRNDLKAGRHSSDYMQKCYNKYGESVFEIEILESFGRIIPFKSIDYKEVLLKKEEYYINLLHPDFNTQLRPYSDFSNFCDAGNPVYQYDLEGNFIRKWKNSAEVIRTLGFSPENGLRNQSAGGFQWTREYVDHLSKYKRNSGSKMRKVCSIYNLFGKRLQTFESITDLLEFLFPDLNRCELCNKTNFIYVRLKSEKGFWNKYRVAYGNADQLDNSWNKTAQRKFILVEYDLEGNQVGIWENLEIFNKSTTSNATKIIIDNEICYKYNNRIVKRL